MNNVYMRFPGGVSKTLTLSYDDGCPDDMRLISIMDRYGIKGTFNLNSVRLPGEEQMRLYTESGMEIAVHGYRHLELNKLSEDEIWDEIVEDRKNLEKIVSQPVTGMAYAYGQCNENVVRTIRKAGIQYSRTVGRTMDFRLPTEWLLLDPTCHHDEPALPELTERFLAAEPLEPMMFYVWGHAYEFPRKDNWHVMENFCEKIGGRTDIWYATNIEIYRYVKAYEALVFSAEGTSVYNPGAQDIWFAKDGDVFCVKGGETLAL